MRRQTVRRERGYKINKQQTRARDLEPILGINHQDLRVLTPVLSGAVDGVDVVDGDRGPETATVPAADQTAAHIRVQGKRPVAARFVATQQTH